MKNIDYLELFFKKHKLSGRITVKYQNQQADDEYMSDIIFENGDVININDIIFDIESELEDDVVEQWLEVKKTKDISLSDWIQSDNHYMPKNIDTSSIDEFHKEMDVIMEEVKKNMGTVFELDITDDSGDE